MKFLRSIGLAAMCLVLVATQASAFTQDSTRHSGGKTWTLCSAEDTDDAVCDDGTNDRAAAVLGYTTLLFDASSSTNTDGFTCDIYGGDYAVAAAGSVDLSTSGFQMNSVSLSTTTQAISFSDMPVSVVWVKCGTIGNNTVTVTVTGSK
tara:strand:+ start:72 stop:518 length:447 start_codon:yes stop_codon:yes gene_type:complete